MAENRPVIDLLTFRVVTDLDHPEDGGYYFVDVEPMIYTANPTPDTLLDEFPLLPKYLQAIAKVQERANRRFKQYLKSLPQPQPFAGVDVEMITLLNEFSEWAESDN